MQNLRRASRIWMGLKQNLRWMDSDRFKIRNGGEGPSPLNIGEHKRKKEFCFGKNKFFLKLYRIQIQI